MALRVVRTVSALRRAVMRWRAAGERVALVPTMGALHAGHLALVRAARRRARPRRRLDLRQSRAVRAPRGLRAAIRAAFDADLAALAAMGVDLVWAPARGGDVSGRICDTGSCRKGPATAGLEDRFRPHFFSGVATVVGKLLIQCAPDFAMFGEKDYQQLKVVTRLADGPRPAGEDRRRSRPCASRTASRCPRATATCSAASAPRRRPFTASSRIAPARSRAGELARARRSMKAATAIERAGFALDYLEARHADTLARVASLTDGPIRLLVAARIGKTRLIDNMGEPRRSKAQRVTAERRRRVATSSPSADP